MACRCGRSHFCERRERRRQISRGRRRELGVGCDLRLRIAQVYDPGVAETPEAEPEVEWCACHEDEVGLRQRERTGTREGELVIGRQRAATHAVDERRDPRLLDERAHRPFGARPVHVAARDEHRTARRADELRDPGDRVVVRCRVALRLVDGGYFDIPGPERVEWNVDERWPAMRCGRGTTRGVDFGDDRVRRRRSGRALGDRSDDRDVVELL